MEIQRLRSQLRGFFKRGELDMTVGKPLQLLLKFSLPMLLGNLLQQLYNMVDSIIVGRVVGQEALAAVGATYSISFLAFSLFIGVGIGASVLISQYFGAKDHEKMQSTADTIYRAMLWVGLLFSLAGVFGAPWLVSVIKVPAEAVAMSTAYMRIVFIGLLGVVGYNVNAGILQGMGDTISPLIYLAIAAVMNVVLDLLFVAVWQMGVEGAAWATVISQATSFLYGVFDINRKSLPMKVRFFRIDFNWAILGRAVKIGFPAAMQNAFFSLGMLSLQRLINSFGTAFMAGFVAANKIDAILILPIISYSNAMTAYTGQNIGAKRLDRLEEGLKAAHLLNVLTLLLLIPLVILLGPAVIGFFLATPTPEVLEAGMAFIWRVVPLLPMLGVVLVQNGLMRGAGQALIPMVTSLSSLWVARVPLGYFFAEHFGKEAIYWSWPAGWVLGLTVSLAYYRSKYWKQSLHALANRGLEAS